MNQENHNLPPCSVLIVVEDSEKNKIYSDLIREPSPIQIDVSVISLDEFYRKTDLEHPLVVFSVVQNGLDLIEKAKQLNPSAAVILIAEQGSVQQAIAAIRMGAVMEYFRDVQKMLYHDDLTGLYNTRYLNDVLDEKIAQFEAGHESSFAILFIDLDRFKQMNDTHGHAAGNKLLQELGKYLNQHMRKGDLLFRYGGDEFVAVLSTCNLSLAEATAEKLRKSVSSQVFLKEDGLNVNVTISVGVALFPDHVRTKRDILEAADHAMYNSKKNLRNCVSVCSLGINLEVDQGACKVL